MRKRIYSILMIIIFALCLVGCNKTGLLPNGKYIEQPNELCFIYAEKSKHDFYFEIKGDTACWVVSGAQSYKAKIVEKDGDIYFEGYKWKSITGKECGFTHIYQVAYNEEERSIRLQLVG